MRWIGALRGPVAGRAKAPGLLDEWANGVCYRCISCRRGESNRASRHGLRSASRDVAGRMAGAKQLKRV